MPTVPLTVLAASADRQALIPMAAGYLILMPALAFGLRRAYRPKAAPPSPAPPPSPALDSPALAGPALAWRLVGTVIGGYLLLMAVVVAYYYAVARVGPGFLENAVTGNALLVALTAPVFAIAAWLAPRIRRRRPASDPPVSGELLPGRAAGRGTHLLIGYLAWAVLFGALFAWEGLALAGVTGVPALSDVVRVVMRYPAGRWVLFALWLWSGWRVFVRRWLFPRPAGPENIPEHLSAVTGASGLVVPEVIVAGPDTVARHVEPASKRFTPFRGADRLAPVVSHPDGPAILDLAEGHVPVQAPVAVVAGPLGGHDVAQLDAAAGPPGAARGSCLRLTPQVRPSERPRPFAATAVRRRRPVARRGCTRAG